MTLSLVNHSPRVKIYQSEQCFFHWASPQENFAACVASGIVFGACESFGGKAGANACMKEATAEGARKFRASPPDSLQGFVAPTNDPPATQAKKIPLSLSWFLTWNSYQIVNNISY